ncbi:hypothetical protein HYC85_000581 [Camellia sinensis]|uniref:CCHC-type domain-containing protein n=1 Tax=Camellia sinensis TaxID=4442 RepID=A0A7J7I2X6_CAMSI|nr:hypothetical protein HYC85_000581 [Camellia sinensis]
MSYKGKGIAVDDSSGKRKRDDGGGKNSRRGKRKNRGVVQFFDDAAYEVDEGDDASDESDFEDDFLEDEFKTQLKVKSEPAKTHNFPVMPKEEELSEEELEKLLEERYKPGSSFVTYAEDLYDSKRMTEGNVVIPSSRDPTIWKVKCMVGRERHSAFCLMQKYVDLHALGTKLQIISAFALEHVKGFIYIEAERQFDVNEACKGICTVYSSRVAPVTKNEVSHLLTVRSKHNEVSVGTWARVKNGKYKGDLAQVIAVNDARKKATVKLIPRVDLQAMAEKYGGGIAAKKTAATPAPRLISSTELEEFRPLIQYRRDRDTGQAFDVLDGMMLKDGYLYKKVSIESLCFGGVMPTEDELLKFEPSKKEESDCQEWLTQLFGEPKKKLVIKSDKGGGKGEGSSSSNMPSGFEVHDLVFFGRKDFGVVVGTEKEDYFKILKHGSDGQMLVTVELHRLKNGSFDKKLTALDHGTKTISINDTVMVLEGPFQGRQGIVKQIYRGIVFLYDENEQENSGYICCKAQFCEKIKLSDDACKGKGGESGASGFEDFPSSPKSPLSPKKAWQSRENGNNFNQGDKDGMFSVGQSLRIRVGPLKGYLCRVLAVRRSDITVKLDSQQKILTVKSEHLAEVRGKSSAISLGDDAEPGKPFDLLGTQDGSTDWMAGAGTSTEGGDRWGAGGLSTERSSWPAFQSSGFSLQPESSFANGLSTADNDTNKAGDNAWEIKATSNQNSSWGSAVPDEKASEQVGGWGKLKIGTSDSANDAGSSWGKKNDATNDSSAWGKAVGSSDKGTGGWGSAGGNSVETEAESSGWGKMKNDGGAKGWGSASKGTEEDSWGKTVEKSSSKDDSSGSKAAWNSSTSAPESQTGGWGNKQTGGSSWSSQAGGSSWGKQNDVNMEDASKETGQNDSWGKPSGGWKKDDTFDGGRGSGGGRGRGGGGGACYKCGETGHMARECSQGGGGGGGGGNACYKCGEMGHMARECSQGGGGGGRMGGNACYKCGETGHMARECPQGGGGGGGSGGNACFKCGETGHMARECPQGGGNACFKCGESGHMARDCSQGGGGGGGGGGRYGGSGGGNACFKCGETGHMARDCSQVGSGGGKVSWSGSLAESKNQTGGWSSGSGGWGSGSTDEPKRQTGGWGSGSTAEPKSQTGGWGSGSTSEPKNQTGGWGSGSTDEPKSQTGGWGNGSTSEAKNQIGGWSSGSTAEPKNQTGGWGNGSSSELKNQTGGWSSGSMAAEPKNQTGGWSSGSMAEPKNQTGGGWGSGSTAEPKNQTGGWGGGSKAEPKKNQTGGWGGGSTDEPKNQAGGWGSGSTDAAKNQTGGWVSGSTAEPKSQGTEESSWAKTAGESTWNKKDGGSSWNKQGGGSSWSNQAGGSSWSKQNDVNMEDVSKGSTGQSDSWSKPSGGWKKDDSNQQESWATKSFDGGRGSGGGRGRGGGRNACYKCGETGHMARECPQGGGGGGGGGGNACFKCGETGHMARECPQGGGGGGRYGGSSGGNACFKCGETGHMARECPQGGGRRRWKARRLVAAAVAVATNVASKGILPENAPALR